MARLSRDVFHSDFTFSELVFMYKHGIYYEVSRKYFYDTWNALK